MIIKILFTALFLFFNSSIRAAQVAAPSKAIETYCNERIGVICFISASEDISCVPLKDTKIKSCKDAP